MSRQNKVSKTIRCLWALSGFVACVTLIGCGAKETPTAPSGKSSATAKAAGTPAPSPDAATAAVTARPPQYVSVFSTTDPKDPFNPKVKPKATTTAANTAPVQTIGPQDIIAALEAGFTGTFGAPTDRIALVHGLTLEQNRDTTLIITMHGTQRRVKVRPIRILRDTMEAQVEGVPNVATLKVRR